MVNNSTNINLQNEQPSLALKHLTQKWPRHKYSQTCVKRSPLGQKCGLIRQVTS